MAGRHTAPRLRRVPNPSTLSQELAEISYPNAPPFGVALSCDEQWVCRGASPTYIGALYTVSSVSAVIATRGNTVEQTVSILLMLAGGTVWAQVTGIFCGVLATMNPHGTAFRIALDDLNAFAHAKRFPKELQWCAKLACPPEPCPPSLRAAVPRRPALFYRPPLTAVSTPLARRLREYFHKTRHITITDANNVLLRKMSPALQGEVLWRTNAVWLKRVPFMRSCEAEFVAKVLLSLRPVVFAPGDIVFGNHLYILHHGVAVYGGRILTAGNVRAEGTSLLSCRELPPPSTAPWTARP